MCVLVCLHIIGMSTVHAMVLELQCNHDQTVCPLQNITSRCVVVGKEQALIWKLQSYTVAQIDSNGTITLSSNNSDIVATSEVLDNRTSSSLSFTAQLQYNIATIECYDDELNNLSCSYTIIGRLLILCTSPNTFISSNHVILVLYRETRFTSD